MSKERFYLIAALVLLLSNLLLVILLWYKPTSHRPENKQIIIERLHFDKQQEEAYLKTVSEHQRGMRAIRSNLRQLQTAMYKQLASSEPVDTDSLANEIAVKGKELELLHYHHFLEIKQICRPDQLALFNELSEDLADMFHPRPPHR